MKRAVFTFAIVLALLFGPAGTAQAVTNGIPDGDNHPYVGLLLFTDGTGYWRCSGSLISPTVVLTAGHCTDGAIQAWVTFESDADRAGRPLLDYLNSGIFITGTAYTYPEFCIGCGGGLVGFAANDVGVVVLDAAAPVTEFAQLPDVGYVDDLESRAPVDIVGYGVQERVVGGGPPVWVGVFMRYYAPSLLVPDNGRLHETFLKVTANPAQGKGGTCFGDSGGPILYGDTVLGVNSFVTNGNCAGVTYSQRVDLPEILEWIESFL